MLETLSLRIRYLLTALKRPESFTYLVSSTFAIQTITLLVVTLNMALVARQLGTEGKGLLQLGTLTVSMLALFLSGGLAIANIYFAGSRLLDVSTLTSVSVTYTLLATLIGVVLVILLFSVGAVTWLLPNVPDWLLGLMIICFPSELLRSFCYAILQGIQKIVIVNRLVLWHGLITLLLTLILVLRATLGLSAAAAAYVIASWLSLFLATRRLSHEGGKFRPTWNIAVLRQMLALGLKGYVGNVLQFYNYRLDNFIVNSYLGASEVGVYSISVRMAELLWRFPDAVSFVILPKAAATDRQIMNRFTPRIFRLTLVITTLGAFFLTLIGKPFIQIVYSSLFLSAFAPMLWLLPGVVLLGSAKVLTNEIAGRGYPHYNSINSGLALVLTVIFDLLLIPRWGVVGAAAASTISYTATFILAILFYQSASRKSRLHPTLPEGYQRSNPT